MTVRIESFSTKYAAAAHDLVATILVDEFGLEDLVSKQRDLVEIEQSYSEGASRFWVALDGTRVVGTIGFIDMGGMVGRVRKMFVHGDYRRTGLGSRLLETLESWAAEQGKAELYLRTHERFVAAHAFYNRHGFTEIPASEYPGQLFGDHSEFLFFSRVR